MNKSSHNKIADKKQTKKIKLCIVTPSLAGGGAERIAVNLANHYTKKGINTTLLAISGSGPYQSQIDPKVDFVVLNVGRAKYSLGIIYKELMRRQPTHILSSLRGSNMVLGIALFFNRKSKLVFREASTMDAITRLNLLKKIRGLTKLRLAYLRANKILANSPDTKNDLVNHKIAQGDKISVIPNPVLPDNYRELSEENITDEWVNNSRLKIILNVGRLHKLKNQHFLIKSFKPLVQKKTNLRLIILGEGDEKTNLLNLISKLNLNEFVKIVPFQQNPWPYYKNADLFVLTSLWEGFGNVIVEALACGTPIVSADCPGGPAYILENGKYGELVPPNDKNALQKAILDIVDRKVVYDKEQLIQRGNEFTVDKIAQRYLKEILDT